VKHDGRFTSSLTAYRDTSRGISVSNNCLQWFKVRKLTLNHCRQLFNVHHWSGYNSRGTAVLPPMPRYTPVWSWNGSCKEDRAAVALRSHGRYNYCISLIYIPQSEANWVNSVASSLGLWQGLRMNETRPDDMKQCV